MATDQLLEVVNEAGEVIGTALHSEIHAKGLLHQEVHVLFITPGENMILQRRGAAKDWGGFLDATAGGHVELGQTFEAAALMEIEEETGLTVLPSELSLLDTIRLDHKAPDKPMRNNVLRRVYGYAFNGDISDLAVELGEGGGFVSKPLGALQVLTPEDGLRERIVPNLLGDAYQELYRKLSEIV